MERLRVHTTKITEDIIKLQCGYSVANIYYYNFRTGSFKSELEILKERHNIRYPPENSMYPLTHHDCEECDKIERRFWLSEEPTIDIINRPKPIIKI